MFDQEQYIMFDHEQYIMFDHEQYNVWSGTKYHVWSGTKYHVWSGASYRVVFNQMGQGTQHVKRGTVNVVDDHPTPDGDGLRQHARLPLEFTGQIRAYRLEE
jgi:hypothetical protein